MTQYVTIEQMDGWAELTGVDARQVPAAIEATLDALWLQLAEQRQEAWLVVDTKGAASRLVRLPLLKGPMLVLKCALNP